MVKKTHKLRNQNQINIIHEVKKNRTFVIGSKSQTIKKTDTDQNKKKTSKSTIKQKRTKIETLIHTHTQESVCI